MFNNEILTRDCINATIENAGIEHDIIVVDDGSKEPFHDDRVMTIRSEHNEGFTAAVNRGLLSCSCDYVLVLNNDTQPYPNFLKLLVDAMEKDKDIAVACSARVYRKKPEFIFNQALDLIKGWHRTTSEDLKEEIVYCTWVSMCSMLIRNEALRYIGLLDRRMKNHCSDNDFCLRARMAGYKVALVPKSKVFHYGETTIHQNNITPNKDQEVLIKKIAGGDMQNILNELPFDISSNTWGKLELVLYKK